MKTRLVTTVALSWLFAMAARCPAARYDWDGSASTDWGTDANWTYVSGAPAGLQPTSTDEARISINATVVNNPDVGAGSYRVNYLNFQNVPTAGWRISGTGGGSLEIGTGGLYLGGNTGWFTNNVRLFINGNQNWSIYNSTIRLGVPLNGTGVVSFANQTVNPGTITYTPTNNSPFRGGFVMNGGTFQTQQPCGTLSGFKFHFGRNATGTAPGLITVNSMLGPGGGYPYFRFVPNSTLAGGGTMWCEVQNDFVVGPNGGGIAYKDKRDVAGNAQPIPVFGGRLYLNGPLNFRFDLDAWGTASYNSQNPRMFLGGIELMQSTPVNPEIRITRQSRDIPFASTISDGAGVYKNPLTLNTDAYNLLIVGTNTYANGTFVDVCGNGTFPGARVDADPGSKLGTGNVTVYPQGVLRLKGTGIVAAGRTVTLEANSLAAGVLGIGYSGALPAFNNDVAAVLAVDLNDSTEINNYLATTGPGSLFVGTLYVLGTRINGASLLPGTGNTYRLGGGTSTAPNWWWLPNSSGGGVVVLDRASSTAGVLTGNNDLVVGFHGVKGGGGAYLRDANTFTGSITIRAPLQQPMMSVLEGDAQLGGGNPFGSDAGSVALVGGALRLLESTATVTNRKGAVTFSSECLIQASSATAGRITGLRVASLTRTDRGVLNVRAYNNVLQGRERVLVDTPPAVNNGMCQPHFIAVDSSGTATNTLFFAKYDSATPLGFGIFKPHATMPVAPGAGTEVVEVAANTDIADTRNIYALRLRANLTNTGGKLNIHSGGLIVSPAANCLVQPALNFTNNEAVVTVLGGYSLTVNGLVSGTNGLTKAGGGTLVMTNKNNTITGDITINNGILTCLPDRRDGIPGSLGPLSNNILLNGGQLGWQRSGWTTNDWLDASRTITLGPLGGRFIWQVVPNATVLLRIKSKMTGPGALYCPGNSWGAGIIVDNALNDYAGGTLIASENGRTYVETTAKLGTGPVIVQPVVSESEVDLYGDENLKSVLNTYLPLHVGWGGEVYFVGVNPVMGSLSGGGMVQVGDSGRGPDPDNSTTLTLGLDNGSSTFVGQIVNGSATRIGSVTKDGSGTWTLYGEQRYTGPTTVNNGTLNLMGSVSNNVVVGATGTISGSGLVKGNLTLNGGTFAVTLSSTFQPLHVNGSVTIAAGSNLSVSSPAYEVGSQDVTIMTGGSFTTPGNLTPPAGYLTRAESGNLLIYRPKGTLLLIR